MSSPVHPMHIIMFSTLLLRLDHYLHFVCSPFKTLQLCCIRLHVESIVNNARAYKQAPVTLRSPLFGIYNEMLDNTSVVWVELSDCVFVCLF